MLYNWDAVQFALALREYDVFLYTLPVDTRPIAYAGYALVRDR